jgi:hypothetical protein
MATTAPLKLWRSSSWHQGTRDRCSRTLHIVGRCTILQSLRQRGCRRLRVPCSIWLALHLRRKSLFAKEEEPSIDKGEGSEKEGESGGCAELHRVGAAPVNRCLPVVGLYTYDRSH